MSGDDRLERLKNLVARLEQLPGSVARDRVLGEVRARAVDLDTGFTPRAMLPVDPAGIAGELEPDRRRTRFVAPPATAKVAPTAPSAPPRPVKSPPTLRAPATHAIDLLAADERLCLDEPPPLHAEAPGEQAHRPWQRGLRG
jgi:hypothetical protein